jgi:hypothetical protein
VAQNHGTETPRWASCHAAITPIGDWLQWVVQGLTRRLDNDQTACNMTRW